MTDEGSLAGRGLRAARRPGVSYRQLLDAAEENYHPNPDTPSSSSGQPRKLGGGGGGDQRGLAQAAASDAEAEAGAARPAKRQRSAKAVAQAVLEQVEAQYWDEEGPEPAVTRARKPRQRRQRVLVDVHGGTGNSAATGAAGRQVALEHVENEYERQRLERIRRNEQMLAQLGVQEAAGGLAAAVAAQQQAAQPAARGKGAPRPRERRPAVPAVAAPVRKSARQRGERPLAPEEAAAAAAAELGAAAVPDLATATDKELEHGALLELEHYFELIGQDVSGAVHADGRFRGWVNPAICERYGIAGAPDAAWEAGGGGQYSFKIDKKAVPAGLKGRGWSDARAFSHTQLQKNPNAYFYRHVAPHEQQAQGEWTEEEHQLFVETARKHGVGDKWGLFASYLPQRVGYQCSAYYRDVIIPQGLVIDRRFKMTRNGRAVYVG